MSGINRAFFDGLMRDKDVSLRGLASRLGMNHSQLSLTFSGARKMQLDEAAQLSSFFGVPIESIIENMGVPLLLKGRACDVVGYMLEDGTVQQASGKAIMPDDCPSNAVAVQARCKGHFMDGWMFFAAKRQIAECVGRFCLVSFDGRMAMAAVSRGYRDGLYNLYGVHSADGVQIESCAVVVAIRP